MEYGEMLERLLHIRAWLDSETRKFYEGEAKRQFSKDLEALDRAIKIVEENQ